MSQAVNEGSWVRCHVRGQRTWVAQVRRVHSDHSVDVIHPRTGNLRTLSVDLYRLTRKPRATV
jgi:hypothetical protein